MLMNNHKNINFSVSFNHRPISKQRTLKHLGVILDDKLNWKPQIEKLVTQLSKWSMVNGLLFHMTQPTSRSIIKAIACSKPIVSEHWSKWKHNGTIVDQCKQRGALCHIGLAKDRGGHLVNQPRLSLFYQVLRNNSWTSNKHNEKKTKKTNEHRTWWRKCTGETACLCTQMSGSNLSEGFWCG